MRLSDFFTKNKDVILCGVYFLLDEDEIIYIGSSKHIVSRVYSHTSSEKHFNQVRFISCDNESKEQLEAQLIIEHNPKYNLGLPGVEDYVTLNHCLSQSKAELNSLIKELPVEFMRNSRNYIKTVNYKRLIAAMVSACDDELILMNNEMIMSKYKNTHKKEIK